MTTKELTNFRNVLRKKQAELLQNSRRFDSIAIERSADALEEAQYKVAREVAVVSLNRESTLRHNVAAALFRIQDGCFGTCTHCGNEIGRRRLEALPWAPLCIRCQEKADVGEMSVLESLHPSFPDAA